MIDEATSEAQTFVYIFSLAANTKIFEFECKGYIQEEIFHEVNELYRGNRILVTGGEVSMYIGKTSSSSAVTEIKEKMKLKYDVAKLQVFYDSAIIEEPITRFISLYTLMLHYCSDSQKEVDDAILKVDETIAQYMKPTRNISYETVFTKLRNELSHKRENSSMIVTHNQIRNNIERFEEIVKSHIFGKI